jgi:hypothetical protein
MQVDINKKYITQSGKKVIIYEIDESQPIYQVLGCYLNADNVKYTNKWTITGKFSGNHEYSEYDLIEDVEKEFQPINHARQLRIVDYHGMLFGVDKRIAWMSTDYNGATYGHSSKPNLGNLYWRIDDGDAKSSFLGKIDYKGDWKKSLMEIKCD